MNEAIKQALRYLLNTGEAVTEEQFDDDHAPVGPQLRYDIARYYVVRDGKMKLTEEGRKLCSS
jgi:hypothetical protein